MFAKLLQTCTVLYQLMCLPDAVSNNGVQGPHLIHVCEAGQVGSQGLAEPLGFLPGALPAQPLLVEHLRIQTSSNEETDWTQNHTGLLMGSNMHTPCSSI